MKRAGLGVLVVIGAITSIEVACTGEDPVLGPPEGSDGGPEASEDGGAPPTDAAPDATRISVAGKLITNEYAAPEEGLFTPLTGTGISVFIGGKQVTTISPTGTFALDDVAIPYDAFVVETNASLPTRVWGYLGLTRPDPFLFGGIGGKAASFAYADGTLTPAPGVGEYAVVAVGGADTGGYVQFVTPETATYAQAHVRWASDPAPQVKAAAYTVTLANGVPSHFAAYGVTAPFVPVAGAANAVQNIALNPIFSSPVRVTAALPPGHRLVKREVHYRVQQGPTFRFDPAEPTGSDLDIALPSNGTAEVHVTTQPSGGPGRDAIRQVLRPVPPNTSTTLTVAPITSRITGPAAESTFTAGSAVTWSAAVNAVYRFRLSTRPATPAASALTLMLHTSGTSVQMPDFAKLGIKFPPDIYETFLTALSPFSSVDGICGSTSVVDLQRQTFVAGPELNAK